MKEKFIQIISGNDCEALFRQTDALDGWIWVPILFWGLTIKGKIKGIVLADEMSGEMIIAEEDKYFMGYLYKEGKLTNKEVKIRMEVIDELIADDEKANEEFSKISFYEFIKLSIIAVRNYYKIRIHWKIKNIKKWVMERTS